MVYKNINGILKHTRTHIACSGQLSCEVWYTDWTYADPFQFFLCADLLNGASLCHDVVQSSACMGSLPSFCLYSTLVLHVWSMQ